VLNTASQLEEIATLNLSTSQGYGVGVETTGGILDVSASARAFDLPAPQDVDDLLKRGLASRLRAAIAKLEGATIWINHDFAQNKTVPHAPQWID
jgi:hypothetical protein